MKAGILIALIPLLSFSQQTANLTIQGTVFVNDTNQPLAAAQVSLTKTVASGSFPPAIAPILTDSRGMFLFKNLDAGSYRITVIKGGGYVQQDSSLTLSEREPANNLTIRMPQTVIVSGRLRDESGRPVVDARVELLRRAYNQNGLNLQSAFSTQTNDLISSQFSTSFFDNAKN